VIAYVDTSALLRLVLGAPGALEQLRTWEGLVASELLVLETARSLDRLRVQGLLSASEALERRVAADELLEMVDLVLLRPVILSRAAEPFAMPLGTLDAVHLATALVWRDRRNETLAFATHDVTLAAAARSFRFDVIGG
jgi:predicted nucleic acid-binding protein